MNQWLKCSRCLKEWEYTGDKKYSKNYPVYVSCPRCHANMKLPPKINGMKGGRK